MANETKNAIAYFEGEFRPLADAKVNVMTHAFLYGTATFEEFAPIGTLSRASSTLSSWTSTLSAFAPPARS